MEKKEPIRIAQVLNKMDNGGIEAVVMNYYRNIDRSRVQFDFYIAEDSTFPQEDELKTLGAGIYKIPKYTKVVKYHKYLYEAFKERKYKIVHAHLNSMAGFPLFAAWRAKVPVRICHNHTTAHWGEGIRTILKYVLRPFAKMFATDYFACGERAGRWMYGNRCFDKGKVTVLNNAIDVEKFAYDEVARNQLRKELGISKDDFVVGHVGRFVYPKNHWFIVNTFAEFKKIKSNAKLLLVGEGELQQEIIDLVKSKKLEDSVIFAGNRNDVYKIYSVMDVFFMPSFYEGLPLVLLEAQANGLPSVCSDGITDEAFITDLAYKLSLQDDCDKWLSQLNKSERHNVVIPESFNIKDASKKLTEYYENKNNL